MKKGVLILVMSLVMVSNAMARDHNRDIHGSAFNGNTNLPNGSGHASDNGDNHASHNGNQNGVGHQNVPSVPVPSALWLFSSTLFGFVAIRRNYKK